MLVWTKKPNPSLERSQPMLPMRPGRPRWSHDYYRHGTTSLFAALDVEPVGLWSHQIAPSKPGICELSASNEREVASDFDVHLIWTITPRTRLLRWPLAKEQTSLASSLHSNPLQLAKPGGALLCSETTREFVVAAWKRRRLAPSHHRLPCSHNANPNFRWTASRTRSGKDC